MSRFYYAMSWFFACLTLSLLSVGSLTAQGPVAVADDAVPRPCEVCDECGSADPDLNCPAKSTPNVLGCLVFDCNSSSRPVCVVPCGAAEADCRCLPGVQVNGQYPCSCVSGN